MKVQALDFLCENNSSVGMGYHAWVAMLTNRELTKKVRTMV